MKRERLEIVWYAVRPLLFYMVLFITIREILLRSLEAALLAASYDMSAYYDLWNDAAGILILGISSAGAAIPLLKDARNEIMTVRRGRERAWIKKRRDCSMLLALLPAGTICLSALLNLLLSHFPGSGSANLQPVFLPLGAAVYGLLTPLIEEAVYRGIVFYRLRRGFPPSAAAVISSALFGAAHGNVPQAVYAFVMGLVFALAYELTRSFEVPFLLHSLCNLAVLSAGSAGWGEILYSPMWILFFAIGAILAFGYLGKRLRDTNYKL